MPDPINGVNGSDPVGIAGAGQTGPAQAAAAEPVTPVATPAQDSADVGQTQALLASIGIAAAAVPDTDDAKIAALQKAIADGTYQVDPQQIAQHMLGLDAALSGSGY